MKNILLHMNDDAAQPSRMEAALAIGRVLDAHLTCCQAISWSSLVSDAYPIALWSGYPMDDLRKESEEAWRAFRDKWETKLAREDVPWTWVRLNVDGPRGLRQKSALADLTMVSLTDEIMDVLPSKRFLAEVVTSISGPMLGIPDSLDRFEPNGQALVAFDGSEESARALRSSVSLLKAAARVLLVCVGRDEDGRESLQSAAKYLGRYGVEAEIDHLVKVGSDSDTILEAAKSVAADLIVMGAYGRPRMAEMILGGVTQHMLSQRDFPILFHH
ncbi:MAG: universal stress protein [Pseudomonadota bacterium]